MAELPSKFELDYSRMGLNDDDRGQIAKVFQEHIREISPIDTGYGRSTIKVDIPGASQGTSESNYSVDMVGYMWALNNGFAPYIMTGLIGRTIPIRLPSGVMIFRRATAENVGARRIQDASRDKKTGRILPGNKPIAWRHPGHPAMKFVQRGISQGRPQAAQIVARSAMRNIMEQVESHTRVNND